MVRLAPEDGDAVARLEQREGTPVYCLRTAPGPDQCVLHSRDEAVAQVLAFAKRAKLRAWLMNEGDDSVLLEDFRVAQPPARATSDPSEAASNSRPSRSWTRPAPTSCPPSSPHSRARSR